MWFKVDDQLPDHNKARKAGTAAMGLWVLCGAWSAGHLTDGWVPEVIALRYGTRKQAQRLVEAGLWLPATVDGEPGWAFHDWEAHQPSRQQVQQRRKTASVRQQNHRNRTDVRLNDARPITDPLAEEHDDVETATQNETADQDPASRRESQHESHVTPRARDARSRPDPSRKKEKDPPCSDPQTQTKVHGTRIPKDFTVTAEMIAWARKNTPNVGQQETDQFRDYWRAASGQRARKRDWVAAWRTWMRKAQQDAERRQQPRHAGSNGGGGYQSRTDANIEAFLNQQPPPSWSWSPSLYALPGGETG